MARVTVTGATGTVGRALVRALTASGDTVAALSRSPERARGTLGEAGVEHHAWSDPQGTPPPAAALAGADAVIHLLGEPIAQRWNETVKREIRDSRVLSTRMLARALHALPEVDRPRVLVSQSASGYYGPRGAEPVEETAPAGDDFLAGVVVAWEAEARTAEDITRVVLSRTGVVLSPSGGALGTMLPFFRAGLGGPVAGGRQFVPWIHLDDVVGALLATAREEAYRGPVNVTAPTPATNRELTRALARTLHRPAIFPVPTAALKVLYGEMAQVVTTGVNAIPAVLQSRGYSFRQPQLEPALQQLLG